MFINVVSAIFVCLVASASAATKKVWVDTDPAIGSLFREVDDAFALFLALHSPEIDVVGISTSYGNASLTRTTKVAQDLVARSEARGKVAVYPGARSAQNEPTPTLATKSLFSALERNDRVTYVALAPLTNLAAFLRIHPRSARRIARVIIVGGQSPPGGFRFGPGGLVPVHDANITKDPVAAESVLTSGIEILLAPIETSQHFSMTTADMKVVRAGGQAGKFLQQNSRVWLWFWNRLTGNKGGPVFDALGVTAAARPDLIKVENCFACVRSGKLISGRTPAPGSRQVGFCSGFDEAAKVLLRKRINLEPRGFEPLTSSMPLRRSTN